VNFVVSLHSTQPLYDCLIAVGAENHTNVGCSASLAMKTDRFPAVKTTASIATYRRY
jgi:hypothetical protein